MKPSNVYLDKVKKSELSENDSQIKLLYKLDDISEKINKKTWGIFNNSSIKGLYIHGKVGRGKTQLMDIFYENLKTDKKIRLHFHRFMKKLHDDLAKIKNTIDPIFKIVKEISKKTRVLCFDEFYVEDIGDAMLLSRFLNRAFESGIILITTSNTMPRNLYENGLHRSRFMPAIQAIEHHCDVYELISEQDYRLRTLSKLPVYLVSNRKDSLEESFTSLLGKGQAINKPIKILSREIIPIKYAEGIIWFTFDNICLGSRSSKDYIELTKEFHTMLISNIPSFTNDNEEASRRFIALVDECYERNVNLIISSEMPLNILYQGTTHIKPFERTISRLTEMQSKEFLSKPHLP